MPLLATPPAQASPPASVEAAPGLVDQDGRPFALPRFQGRWVWLYMGYASCPDLCPSALNALAAAHDQLGRPRNVQPLFVSVDPLRDPPSRIKAYLGFFSPELAGATGSRAALEALARGIGARYAVPADARADGAYVVGHPDVVFVIAPDGTLAARLPIAGDAAAGTIAADMARRLAPPPPTAAGPTPPPAPSTAAAWCGLPGDETGPALEALMARARTMGSGTSVLPALSPMRMWARPLGGWLWMAHGEAVAGLNQQGGPRGGSSWAAENWQMLMGSRYAGPGIVDLRAMTSLEPWTLPAGGTPQLLQSGETWRGLPIVDRQHPHDLLMELAGRYTWNLGRDAAVFGYGGLVGEPALGPTAFMHRPSATDNRWAPLGHHQQDATHLLHGVATAGARLGAMQLEASRFNGREPDEDRVALELGPLDSWSARASWFPGRNVVGQVSHGRLATPSLVHPGDETITTASLSTVYELPPARWSTSAIWGRTVELGPGDVPLLTLQSYGVEGQLDVDERWHAYGRFELLDRAGLPPFAFGSHVLQRTGALTLGASHELGAIDRWAAALGADVTGLSLESLQRSIYGDDPWSARVYLRLRPPTMSPGAFSTEGTP